MLKAQGFTVVEVIVALVILSAAVLGLAGTATSLTMAAASAEIRAQALNAAQDRIARIDADPNYDDLEDYEGTENGVPASGFTRITDVTHVTRTNPTPLDYKVITVVVTSSILPEPVELRTAIAAP